ncbi:hypothetical protein [Paraburkholderia sp. J8-2]|uniref:hypothetical protein n=1 Tax=Paraburkholderia sp. J8-2 TaxID=2805440 RepID=UPI002AB74ECF|nr:hypothetical protein [Paraburkholderia sp. J8-2]
MNEQRNLQIGCHPLIAGRRYPVALHHWCAGELRQFLTGDHYPRHTFDGHEQSRRQAAVDALDAGRYVPDVVLSEDPELVDLAAEQRSARNLRDANHECYVARLSQARDRFERKIGFSISFEAYHAQITAILKGYFSRESVHMGNAYDWLDETVVLQCIPGRRPRYCQFGMLDAGRQPVLRMRFGAEMGFAHDVEWDVVNELLLALLCAREISLEHVWIVFGTGWLPRASTINVSTTRLLPGRDHSRVLASETLCDA